MSHILNRLHTAETKAAHRGRWYVWAGGQRMRHQATMRGRWGGGAFGLYAREQGAADWGSHVRTAATWPG